MEKYVLDTNLFFNMEAGLAMGEKTQEVVKKITYFGKKIKKEKKGEFFMPPSVVQEFLSFFEEKKQPFIEEFISTITIKSPDYGKLSFSAHIFYRLIEEVRERSYRGLNIGEELIKEAGRLMMGGQMLAKKDFEIKIGEVIKRFRERYRQATRVGFLDSLTDLDLIVLAKEIDGFLISTDEGVLRWGRIIGVKELPASVWRLRLEDCLKIHYYPQEKDLKANEQVSR